MSTFSNSSVSTGGIGWAGINWQNGVLINGKRYQRSGVIMDWPNQFYDEDLYAGLW